MQPITRTRSRNRGKARTNERTNEGTGANQFSEEARSTTLESFYFHARGKRSSLVQPAPTPRPAVPTDPTTLWIRSGVLRSASARANSSSRTRVQLLSSLFLQLAFIRAARFNSGCGAPRAKSGNARGKLLSLSLSLCPSPHGFARTVKRGGFLRELRNYVKREGFHLLATGDPAGLSCKAQLRSFDYFI